jgi:ubiquinone/menaquinone biosynthesis C-methylase UbiE
VLHHSPNLPASLAEFFRVLKPGGEFGMMLYSRHSLLYVYWILYREGFLHQERKFLNPLQLASRYTDDYPEEGNPHTWPVTQAEVREMFAPYAKTLEMRVFGMEFRNILGEMLPGIAKRIPTVVMKAWSRRWGWSIWISGTRR